MLSAAHDAGAPAPASDQRRAAAASTAEMQGVGARTRRRGVRGGRRRRARPGDVPAAAACAAAGRWCCAGCSMRGRHHGAGRSSTLWERRANSTASRRTRAPTETLRACAGARARRARRLAVRRLRRRRGGAAGAPPRPRRASSTFSGSSAGARQPRARLLLPAEARAAQVGGAWAARRRVAAAAREARAVPAAAARAALDEHALHRGPLHYDEQENLHAVVLGAKRFELFHPSAGAAQLYDGTPMRTMYHLWRWDNASRRGHLHALDPLTAPPAHQPFSPVSVRRPTRAATLVWRRKAPRVRGEGG